MKVTVQAGHMIMTGLGEHDALAPLGPSGYEVCPIATCNGYRALLLYFEQHVVHSVLLTGRIQRHDILMAACPFS
jgi:hypothetical protein